MRLKSEVWVGAYVRRCSVEGIPVVVARRGASDAGAIFIKVNRLDGTASIIGPAPQAAFEAGQSAERLWISCTGPEPVEEAAADGFLARQERFDGDLWVVEIEARDGRHLVEPIVD